jgi:hypothetical protein
MNQKKKKEPWRLLVGIIAIAYIVYTWVEKDIFASLTAVSGDQALPMAATSMAVTLAKVAIMAAIIFVIKWMTGKGKGKQ